MPRRNRNASPPAANPDLLADQASHLARDMSQSDRLNAVLAWAESWQVEITPLPPAQLCAACRVNLAIRGGHCARCSGHITASAHDDTLRRR